MGGSAGAQSALGANGKQLNVAAETPLIFALISAAAIQLEPVDAGDIKIPTEFRAAVYEFLVIQSARVENIPSSLSKWRSCGS